MLTIHVVSDSTGETADRVARAALVQFVDEPADLVRHAQVRTPGHVRDVVREAAGHPSIVLHTLVSDELRHVMVDQARTLGVDALDLLGPVLERLALHLQLTPREKPGLFGQRMAARSREIEAVEFAFRHDDGQRAAELVDAEAVLVGASRTMKTPTCLFLAYRGWFAGNVPLVPGTTVPGALLALPAERVLCLVMSPTRLLELRRARASHLSIPDEPYASLAGVQVELRHSRTLSAEHGWRLLDVTGRSVEEVAREVMVLLAGGEQSGRPAW